MKRKAILAALLLAMLLLACGCTVETAQTLYQTPRRTAEQEALLLAQESAMQGREYALAGAQKLHPVELDGNGEREYLIFARREGRLQVLVLADRGKGYELSQVIDCPGASFGRIDYLPVRDGRAQELMLWLMDEKNALAAVQAYSFQTGQAERVRTGQPERLGEASPIYRIRWNFQDSPGTEEWSFTNFQQGWSLSLEGDWVSQATAEPSQGGFAFYLKGETEPVKIFTVYTITGADREALATSENRFILGRSTGAVYCAYLEVASGTVALTQEHLKTGFSLLGTAGET